MISRMLKLLKLINFKKIYCYFFLRKKVLKIKENN